MIKHIETLKENIKVFAESYEYEIKYLVKETDCIEVAFINTNVKRTAFIVCFTKVHNEWNIEHFISMFNNGYLRLNKICKWFN